MYWEIAGHAIALTGDGYYDEGWPDEWLILRCLQCPDHEGGCNHLLFLTEEDPRYDGDGRWIDPLHPIPMLQGVLQHLREEGADVPRNVEEAARTLTALGADWSSGIDFLYEQLGSGKRLRR